MLIKTPEEIKLIKQGGQIMGRILEDLAKMCRPGMSTWEVDQLAEKMIIDAGGIPAFKGYKNRPSDTPFPSTICASINEEVVHGIAKKNAILLLILVCSGLTPVQKARKGILPIPPSPFQLVR
jgi:methionyl aminopeptidase